MLVGDARKEMKLIGLCVRDNDREFFVTSAQADAAVACEAPRG